MPCRAGRLEFTTDLEEAVRRSRIVFLALGTPPAADGSADLSSILAVAETIGRTMDGYRIVVMKSTVPVGTHRRVTDAIAAHTAHPIDYVSNPEFMKEGAAIEDFTKPDRVVIGAANPAVVEIISQGDAVLNGLNQPVVLVVYQCPGSCGRDITVSVMGEALRMGAAYGEEPV